MGQQVQSNNNLSLSSISIHSSTKNRSNISAKYPRDIRQNNSVNISTSTENSLRKRRKKFPIPYYHPCICARNDKRSYIEQGYREMAARGILMIKK